MITLILTLSKRDLKHLTRYISIDAEVNAIFLNALNDTDLEDETDSPIGVLPPRTEPQQPRQSVNEWHEQKEFEEEVWRQLHAILREAREDDSH